MAMAVCKPLGILPPTHRSYCGSLISTRQRIKSHNYQKPINTFHHERVYLRRLHVRASRQGDGRKEKCNKEGGVGSREGDGRKGKCNKEGGVESREGDGRKGKCYKEGVVEDGSKEKCSTEGGVEGGRKEKCNKEGGVGDANTDAPSCEENPQSKSLACPELAKEEQEHSSAGKEKPESCRGRLHGLAKLGFQKTTTTSKEEDLKRQQRHQQDPGKQPDVRCRLRSLWRTVRHPQNLLAGFLIGLLLYAIALFGWQVMVVAVDVTLFVLKCSLVALVFLLVYIFLL